MDTDVSKFMEITGLSKSVSISYLEKHKNNLEEALSAHFTTTQGINSDFTMIPSSTSSSFDQITSPIQPQSTQQSNEENTMICSLNSSFNYIWSTCKNYIFTPAKSIFFAIISFILSILRNLIINPHQSNLNFNLYFENKFGLTHPKFFIGTYQHAISTAMREQKLLILYIHNNQCANFDNFLNDVLKNEDIISFLDEHFILFGYDFENVNSSEFPTFYQNNTFCPIFVILHTQSHQNVQPLTFFDSYASSQHIINTLQNLILKADTIRTQIVNQSSIYESDRKIREEQDEEYKQALKMDKEKIEKSLLADKEQKLAQKSLEKQIMQDNMKKQLKKQMKKDIKQQREHFANEFVNKTNILNISEIPRNQKSKICVRLPSGKRLEQFFILEQTVQDIYRWIECCEILYKDLFEVKIPTEFYLSVPSMNLQLTEKEKTLEESGLFPNAVLFLTSLDESDDEL